MEHLPTGGSLGGDYFAWLLLTGRRVAKEALLRPAGPDAACLTEKFCLCLQGPPWLHESR